MGKLYVPAPVEHRVWHVDSFGDLMAMITIFASIILVGLASCWERFA